jgi:hypothetical protein
MKRFSRWLILSSFLVWVSAPLFALNLGEIRDQIRQQVRDTDSTRRRYSDTVLLNFINEIQRDFVNRTWSVVKSSGYILTQNTTYYDLADDTIAINFIYFTNQSGSISMLDERLERSFRQANPDFEREGGTPVEYLVRTSTSGATPLQIGYTPTPNSATSTGTVRIEYISQVTALSSDSDVPFEGYEPLVPYHDSLIWGVAAKIMFIENQVNKANSFLAIYNDLIGLSSNRLGRAPNYVPNLKAGPPRRIRGN